MALGIMPYISASIIMQLLGMAVQLPAKRPRLGGWETWWRRPAYRNVIRVLTGPTYAGAYAYGRTTSKTELIDGSLRKTTVRKPMEEWTVLIPEHHEGYISWDQFLRIQEMLRDNSARFHVEGRPGAPKKGPALLAGLVRCRRCSRKMMVAYSGKNATVPRYVCRRGRLDNMEPKCISFGGLTVDPAVSGEILRVVQPGAIEAAALAVTEEEQRHDELNEARQLELEASRYAAELAHRQYDAVDPDNRLVAAELERRWNIALGRVQELESELGPARIPKQRLPTLDELQCLCADLDRVWSSPRTDRRLKKRIMRTLIEEVVADIDMDLSEVVIVIHWKGGVHTELRVPRRRRGHSAAHTSPDIVEAIRQLTRVCRDKVIAGYLNRNGLLRVRGSRWTTMSVTSLRNKRDITVYTPQRQQQEGWLTLTQAASYLGVAPKTLRRAAERGEVNALHPLHDGPWVFTRNDLDERFARDRSAENDPTGPGARQLGLEISTTYRGDAL